MSDAFWIWLTAAVVLAIVEVFAPGVAFLWLGLAAGVTAIAVVVEPALGWEYQVLIFAVVGVAALAAARRFFMRHPIETTNPNLNARGREYVGREYGLATDVRDGVAQIRLGDGLWRVRCNAPLHAGERVRVVAVEGATLVVEPAAAQGEAQG